MGNVGELQRIVGFEGITRIILISLGLWLMNVKYKGLWVISL